MDRRPSAVRGRQGVRHRHARRDARARAARPRRTRRRQRVRDDHRRQAHNVQADGRGHHDRGLPAPRRRASVHDQDRAAARLGERSDVSPRRTVEPQGVAPRRPTGDLRVRDGPALEARGGGAAARHDQPRRHPPAAPPRDGALPGRVLHLPCHRDPARARWADRRAGRRVAAALPPERWKGVWPILYGDQLRQARFDDWIFQGVLDVEHLPAPIPAPPAESTAS